MLCNITCSTNQHFWDPGKKTGTARAAPHPTDQLQRVSSWIWYEKRSSDLKISSLPRVTAGRRATIVNRTNVQLHGFDQAFNKQIGANDVTSTLASSHGMAWMAFNVKRKTLQGCFVTRVLDKARELISGRIGEVPKNATRYILRFFFLNIYLVTLFDISRNEVA